MIVRRVLRVVVPACVGIVLLVVVFPKVTGAGWGATFRALGTISVPEVVLLTAAWLAGLCCYTLVMRASLPGLSLRQALTLNLGGSAVSNLVPFGGALGVVLNLSMVRSWGFRRSSFATFAAVTTVVNLVAKLVLPVAVLLVVSTTGAVHSAPLALCAETAGGLLAGVALLGGIGLTDNALARRVLSAERALSGRLLGSQAERLAGARRGVGELVEETRTTLRYGWRRIGAGMLGYLALQALLLWMIFRALHSNLTLAEVLVGFALERALTLVVVTPGGVGVAQTGAAAALVALGGDPVTVAAGILLYSVFTFFLEIPVGAAATLEWWVLHRSSPPGPATGAEAATRDRRA